MKNLIITLLIITSAHISVSGQSIQKVKLFDNAEIPPSIYNQYIEFNGKLYISGPTSLWVSDGTESGTQIIKTFTSTGSFHNIFCLTILNNKLIFTAYDSSHGWELWVSDGTSNGTNLLLDINPGPISGVRDANDKRIRANTEISFPQMNGNIYFYGDDGIHGTELWKSDGTISGTSMVKDINLAPGAGMADTLYIRNIIANNNKLFFFAIDTTHGDEIWSSDGTESGTNIIKEYAPGNTNILSGGPYFLILDNKVLFNFGQSLCITDGTTQNTQLLASVGVINSNDNAYLNNKLFFYGSGSSPSSAIFETDGTPSGTKEVYSIAHSKFQRNSKFVSLVTFNNKLYFEGGDPANNYGIWSSDGTNQGTKLEYSTNNDIYNMKLVGDKLYFKQYDDLNKEVNIWSYKGVGSNPEKLAHNFVNFQTNGSPFKIQSIINSNFTAYGNMVLFMHQFDEHDEKIGLYKIGQWPDNITHTEYSPEINIYPNPILNEVTIKGRSISSVSICNIAGSVMLSQPANTDKIIIDTHNWVNGLYMATIRLSDGSLLYRKIVK